jgi:Ni,Fe-hydrogenase I large subunit
MTVMINVGRRVPRSWFRAGINKVQTVLSFQEHLWAIIKQSLNLAKKKANASNTGIKFVITNETEAEDINYQIDWIKVIIQGTKEQEEEEYNEAMGMYAPFGKILKKEVLGETNLKKTFKTKMLSPEKIQEAYLKGFGAVGDSNLSNKLLEMGILTHIEKIDDFGSREVEYNL